VEKLLNILRSKSSLQMPEQMKKKIDFNPILGKYLDAHKDKEITRQETLHTMKLHQ
jgi:hypothetical protein